jgi:hypothetical protein
VSVLSLSGVETSGKETAVGGRYSSSLSSTVI